MRLSNAEFKAMNSRLRAFAHRHIEFPIFKSMGLDECAGKVVVELGCGNGLGAELIATLKPASYIGIDLMPEQIAIAQNRGLVDARFLVGDVTDLSTLADGCADIVAVFMIIHHVPGWEKAIAECRRVLRPGGCIYIEEPDESGLHGWDRIFRWAHPDIGFSLRALEKCFEKNDFEILKKWKIPGVFGIYRTRKRLVKASH
jgi:SAM-dependent methyltransferase